MPITFDPGINPDSSAFVEVVDRLSREFSPYHFSKFETRDNINIDDTTRYIIYSNGIYETALIGVHMLESGRSSLRFIITGNNYLDAVIFYSDKVDSMYLKKCSVTNQLGSNAEMINSYWDKRLAKHIVSNDISLFDDGFWERIKPSNMQTFTPNFRSRKKLGNIIQPIIKRSNEVIENHRSSRFPGSQGSRES